MHNTSMNLPEHLAVRLRALAEQSGSSEEEVIRELVEQRLADLATTQPSEAPVPGRFVGVGVGPGPADLVTFKAVHALRRADRVVAPCTSVEAIGRAEAIVREAAPDVVVERMVFVMVVEHEVRAAALREVCERIVAYLAAGDEVAFITLGDPNLYSTVSSVVAGILARRPGTITATVPGIAAFQALAMEADVVLTDEQQSLLLLPASVAPEVIDEALADRTRTVVLYKGGGRIAAIADHLEAADRLGPAMLGELIGMPGQRVTPVADVRDRPASYLSAVISPAPEGIGPTP
ncbi:precorrin-2 C(20)-methyltransferase [Ilumatobacter sp.]|uniref:precorrin-2 C(20)-methyltransferase n=1 Tax=Ilumatobacter sp. TaxID=1967498 RepID=UPI003752DF3B